MRKVRRTLVGCLVAAVLTAAPTSLLHARPAGDPGTGWSSALERLHPLLTELGLGWIHGAEEVAPSLDPNGRKATMRTPGVDGSETAGTPRPRREQPRVQRDSREM